MFAPRRYILTQTPLGFNEDPNLPSFEHIKNFVSESDRQRILDSLPRTLGHDPSCEFFAHRLKAIRFVTIINGHIVPFSQNYFMQNERYNNFRGGDKQYYNLLPDDMLTDDPMGDQGPYCRIIKRFANYYNIQEKTTILIQVQTSTIAKKTKEKQIRKHSDGDDQSDQSDQSAESITGQGIHSDGADRAALVCLHRGSSIIGAQNQFHAQLDGSKPLSEFITLENSDGCVFKDNDIFHYVSPGKLF